MKYLHLELKVCEGCGMLWLRSKQSEAQDKPMAGIYCAGCESRLAQFPASASKRGGGRPRTRTAGTRNPIRRNRGCASAHYERISQGGSLSPRGYQAGER